MSDTPHSTSPKWSSTAKLVAALTFVAASLTILINFRSFVGPLLLSFIIAYLLHPAIEWISARLKLPWRLTVNLVYIIFIIVLVGLMIWGGIALVEQIQSLIGFLQNAINDLPDLITTLTARPLVIGPFEIGLGQLDLASLSDQILRAVEPLLSQVGTLVGTIATSAVSTIGWIFFVVLIAYFILGETGGVPGQLINFQVPSYREDINRIGKELSRIWNAFLRGQLTIVSLEIVAIMFILGVLGVHYYFGLALLAGLARFVPFVGPAIAWATYGLVAYFQGTTFFGMDPMYYVILVVVSCWLTDMIMDNFVSPRLMANALRVHPAAVLVAALIAASWLGVIGVILAAPVLASLKLFTNYAFSKFFDQDPWLAIQSNSAKEMVGFRERSKILYQALRKKLEKK
jgi:predicted PurR-regulated permease PerM